MVIRIGIAGIGGRMGQEILALARANPAFAVAFGIERPDRVEAARASTGSDVAVVADAASLLASADVLIDFTTPEATIALARLCAEHRMALVAGTTGLTDEQVRELQTRGERAPVFYSRNMSVGINALIAVLPTLVRALDGYDIEIVEAHHRHKADAPSGTALALAEAIASALPQPLAELAVFGRHGHAPRNTGEIGIHAVRGGGNAGEHTIILASDGEEVRIEHRAFSRRTFALGALRAAQFLAGRPAGYYTMTNLLSDS